jgi:hypothetical protein
VAVCDGCSKKKQIKMCRHHGDMHARQRVDVTGFVQEFAESSFSSYKDFEFSSVWFKFLFHNTCC